VLCRFWLQRSRSLRPRGHCDRGHIFVTTRFLSSRFNGVRLQCNSCVKWGGVIVTGEVRVDFDLVPEPNLVKDFCV
jgi:hypothetical protein